MSLITKLKVYAENSLNVMIVGKHGIGKSTVVKEVAESMGLRFKYYSSSTLDPFADLVGIPVPDKDAKHINFCRPQDLEDAEFIFFDELNRAHPRVINAVLEIIQFKSINGKPLKNLKMVWAAINPPGEDYVVEELDPVLMDRFHIYIAMKASIPMDYFKERMATDIAEAVRDWWYEDLSEEQRYLITPRRLEYIGTLIHKDINFRDALPQGQGIFPVQNLDKRLRVARNEEKDVIVTLEKVLENSEEYIGHLENDKTLAIELSKVLVGMNEKQVFACRNLLEAIPKELVMKIGKDKFKLRRRALYEIFVENKVDTKEYPKISEAYEFSNWIG